MTKAQNNETINLQASIIAWIQQQVIQPNFNPAEVKEIIDVLTEATKSYESLFNLEERRLSQDPSAPVVAPPAPPQKKTRQKRKAQEQPTLEPLEEEVEGREYFSLEEAHSDAVSAGYDRSPSVFRRDLTEGAKVFGWRKANRSGNKPSYFKA